MFSAAARKAAGRTLREWLGLGLVVLLSPLLIVLLFVRGAHHVLCSIMLYAAVWVRHERWVVFVYSDSPKWKRYVESRLLPELPPDAVVVNRSRAWSQRSLAVRIWQHFGGRTNYCPMGFVFERGRRVGRFRFFRPFQAAWHGDDAALEEMVASFKAAAGRS